FSSLSHRHPRPPLFPYTTLFRSRTSSACAPSGHSGCCSAGWSRQPAGDQVVFGGEAAMRISVVAAPPSLRSRPCASSPASSPREIGRAPSELQSRGHLVCRLLLE